MCYNLTRGAFPTDNPAAVTDTPRIPPVTAANIARLQLSSTVYYYQT